ncbi:sugar isomerase, KpsF/GutQ family [Basidiobolus meristosporus CBS 931.73]|uniref:Sugar isomerase, KpsF/GutQ family n=1 Tax=Basidiobolus meristosporus CBS 931.73 TaxID=1314790 RepID=A0A1Y1XY61_9FUNG|nr:sugar isomerase, KpsF/GutQ family [Basidiobolus meristosporus CBS 931.73]|eukprot:ORX90688.1 sugar isomerase, KpsF/GutQ family [Basidiobolus meristosporus CBS 931.73]
MMLTADIVNGAVRVLKEEGSAILDCAERINQDPESFSKVILLMQKCLDKGGKIVVTGVGKSGKIGQKITATLQSTGSLAVFLHPTEGLHGDLGLVQPKDVVLALSYTGNTEELLRVVPSFKKRNVILVGLGGNKNSLLAQECDAWLDGYVKSEVCTHVPAPTSSTTVALALGDAIAISLMQLRAFNAQHFALNHPGGSLGRKLTLKVKDVMHTFEEVPIVSQDTAVNEVLTLSMRKKCGSVLVLDEAGESVIGVITDGDIRRALEFREQIFQLQAKHIMTLDPVVCSTEDMASEALRLMKERETPISVLPVLDKFNKLRGLITAKQLAKTF